MADKADTTKRRKSARSGGGRARRGAGAGLRKFANVESVIVEEPFVWLPPDAASNNHNNSDISDPVHVKSSAANTPHDNFKAPPIDTSNKAGEGCYVSATVHNKRYYGVLIDQASLKAASHLWFEDEASSLDLNRRMKILKQQQQQQLQPPPPPLEDLSHRTTKEISNTNQDVATTTPTNTTTTMTNKDSLGGTNNITNDIEVAVTEAARTTTTTSSNVIAAETKDETETSMKDFPLPTAGLKRPPPPTQPSSLVITGADPNTTLRSEEERNGYSNKRPKINDGVTIVGETTPVTTIATTSATTDTAVATTSTTAPDAPAVMPQEEDSTASAATPKPMIQPLLPEETAITTITKLPPPAFPATATAATPATFIMSQPHRQVQKFRYVQQSIQPVPVEPSSSAGRRRGADVAVLDDPGYRDLLATYANVMAAANEDPIVAERIQQACDQGGNFVQGSGGGAGTENTIRVDDYYYQYEVLNTTLTAKNATKHTLEHGLRTSMGLHTFLHNTSLPPWFPLGHSNLGPQRKVLNMLNMKRDNNGNVVYDPSKDLQLQPQQQQTPMMEVAGAMTPMGVTSSGSGMPMMADAPVSIGSSSSSTSPATANAMRLLATSGTRVPMQPRPKPRFQIGVIGGGIAGLACCRELIRELEQDCIDGQVTLLEARPRLGGRLWTDTTTFTTETTRTTTPQTMNTQKDVAENTKATNPLSNNAGADDRNSKPSTSSIPFPVDLGASWIHGIDHNPLAALAKEAGIDFVTTSEQVQMLGANLQLVDATVDERMGKLFDDLLDLAADDCWGAPEATPESTTPTMSTSVSQTTNSTKMGREQSAIRWYSSVFLDSTNDEKDPATDISETKAGSAGKTDTELDGLTRTTPPSGESALKPAAAKTVSSTERQQQIPPLEATGTPRHRQSSDRSIDFEVGKAIGKHKFREFSKLGTEEHRMLLWNTKNVEYALGANISDLSMKYWDSDERHAFEGDHVLLKQGYSSVVQYMSNKLQQAGPDRFQLALNFPVGKVEYSRKTTTLRHLPIISPGGGGSGGLTSSLGRRLDSRELVEMSDTCSITSQDGSKTKYFDFLVCAVPLGVLKESVARAGSSSGTTTNDQLMFQPCLPFSKIDSITNVGFGLLDKVYLQFPKAFWRIPTVFQDDDQAMFGNASGLNPHHYMFLDVGKTLTTNSSPSTNAGGTSASDPDEGPAILMSLVSGKEAIACECLSDEELVEEVMTTLRAIFKSTTITAIPEPSAFRITRWGQDRFSRGSYTFLPPGATDQDFQLLQSPINGNGDSLLLEGSEIMRLFFAGEHTTALHPSMAHGAMLSGIRAAKEIVSTIKHSSSGVSRDDKDIDRLIPVTLFRHKNPDTPLQCSFCQKVGGQVREGSLLAFKRGSRQALAHNNCAEYSPEVEVMDGKWKNVIKAVNRGKFLNCSLCRKSGATMGCTTENCFRVFHFSCAEDCGYRFDRDGKAFYCDLHRRAPPTPPAPHECDRISLQYYLTKNHISALHCFFCGLGEVNDTTVGKLLAFQQLQQSNQTVRLRQTCVHKNCAKYTNIVDTTEVEESRMGHEHRGIFLALAKSKICVKCARRGGTVRCSDRKCDTYFHVPCAQRNGWNFEKRGGTRFKCEIHRNQKSSPGKASSVASSSAGNPVGGLFQHNLLARFGATETGKRVDMPSNLDMGGSAMPLSSPYKGSADGQDSNDGTDISDSEDSFPGQDGLESEVLDVPLSIDIPGSKRLVRVNRSSRDEVWKLSVKVVPCEVVEKSNLADNSAVAGKPAGKKSVLVVAGSGAGEYGLKPGDTIVSINGSKVGKVDLKTLRLVLQRLKREVDVMMEVIRKSA